MFSVHSENEYADLMRRFFQQQFPNTAQKNSGDVFELITDALVASGKVRLGPKPSVESLYQMRRHIEHMMALQEPLRFLMPWGSEKPADLQTVDLAEVAAIKTISCLQERVAAAYSPGIHVRIRIEDATAPNLFDTDRPRARRNAAVYTDSLVRLLDVLDTSKYIEPVPESTMITEEQFENSFRDIYPLMLEYLQASEDEVRSGGLVTDFHSFIQLRARGWNSVVPIEQREHYRATYRRLYGMNDDEATAMLARYLSQALTRRQLDMMGNKEWGTDHLGLTFVGPIPGEPKHLSSGRLYYRTLPENVSTMHTAPWRAKGYFAVSDDNVRPRLASWGDQRQYVQNIVQLSNSNTTVNVQADYEVM